jgi:hypothetical protein
MFPPRGRNKLEDAQNFKDVNFGISPLLELQEVNLRFRTTALVFFKGSF